MNNKNEVNGNLTDNDSFKENNHYKKESKNKQISSHNINYKDKYILLVEDNEDDVELTIRAFKKNNILNKVIILRDGAEAKDFLFAKGLYSKRDIRDLPIVILLDIKLPKIDGIELLKRIRQNKLTKLIPVVILTTSDEETDIIKCYNFGVNSYIKKPVDFERFTEIVEQLGLYWILVNIPPAALSKDLLENFNY